MNVQGTLYPYFDEDGKLITCRSFSGTDYEILGNTYDFMGGMDHNEVPGTVIKSKKTGRKLFIPDLDLIQLAIDRGIDEQDPKADKPSKTSSSGIATRTERKASGNGRSGSNKAKSTTTGQAASDSEGLFVA